jgi:hypothetical protein
MKFFCTIYEPFEGGYKILLNKTNINFLPGKETTLRRIFINADLRVGDTIYVSNSELGSGGKLLVKEAHLLSSIAMYIIKEAPLINEELQAMILSTDTKAIDIYNHVT